MKPFFRSILMTAVAFVLAMTIGCASASDVAPSEQTGSVSQAYTLPSGTGVWVDLPEDVFNDLNPMAYSSTYKAFLDAGSNQVIGIVNPSPGYANVWTYGDPATFAGSKNPKAYIDSATANVINNGTYNATGTYAHSVSCAGKHYYFRYEYDGTINKYMMRAEQWP